MTVQYSYSSLSIPYQRGFTLIELMVTIAILSILLTVGIPNFQTIRDANRVTGAANEFTAALHLARSEAIRRGVDVRLCPSGADWNAGWQVGLGASCATETLRTWGATQGGLQLTSTANSADVAFSPLGARETGAVTFTMVNNDNGREISISSGGSVSVCRQPCDA